MLSFDRRWTGSTFDTQGGEAGREDAEPILVRATLDPERAWLRIEVLDRGEGLPEDLLDHGFEPYDSSKPGGSGLGLAICVRNLEAMGGQLELLHREGGGTLARVRLPFAPEDGPSLGAE